MMTGLVEEREEFSLSFWDPLIDPLEYESCSAVRT
jgi:hypothetical protein